MPLFRRHHIAPFAAQLEGIERALAVLKDNDALPTPKDMQSLAYIRARLPFIITLCEELEPQLWSRVKIWRQTSWTRRQLAMRFIMRFIGAWIIGTMTLWQSILGWFVPLFPAPWMVPAAGAGITFIVLTIIAYRGGLREETERE